MRRLVEAELLFQALDEFRVQPLRPAILRVGGIRPALTDLRRRPARKLATTAATEPLGRTDARTRQLRDDALHRPARRELDDDEADQHDPDQRRKDQKRPLQKIGAHGVPRIPVTVPSVLQLLPDRTTTSRAPRDRTWASRPAIHTYSRTPDDVPPYTSAAPNSARFSTPGRAPAPR